MKRPEQMLDGLSEAYVSTSRNSAIRLNCALSDYFSLRLIGEFARPNSSITVTYKKNSTDLFTNTIDLPLYGYSSQDVGSLNDYCPSISNFISSPSSLHFYSDDDFLTFDLHKYFPSLKHNASFKMAPNFTRSMNHSLYSSSSFKAQHSNAPQLPHIASIAGAISAYIVDEFKLGYLQLLSFSTDEASF